MITYRNIPSRSFGSWFSSVSFCSFQTRKSHSTPWSGHVIARSAWRSRQTLRATARTRVRRGRRGSRWTRGTRRTWKTYMSFTRFTLEKSWNNDCKVHAQLSLLKHCPLFSYLLSDFALESLRKHNKNLFTVYARNKRNHWIQIKKGQRPRILQCIKVRRLKLITGCSRAKGISHVKHKGQDPTVWLIWTSPVAEGFS